MTFAALYNIKKMLYYYTIKGKVPVTQRSSVIYQITNPRCLECYFGKINRYFHIRIEEHNRKTNHPVYGRNTNSSYV